MERTAALLTALPSGQPIIMGGDFNSPAGDAVFRLIPARLHDSFREGGIGWGDTAFNHVPVLRVDQVWISDQLRADVVVARDGQLGPSDGHLRSGRQAAASSGQHWDSRGAVTGSPC